LGDQKGALDKEERQKANQAKNQLELSAWKNKIGGENRGRRGRLAEEFTTEKGDGRAASKKARPANWEVPNWKS
jgi:hypothetical protein